MACTRFEQQYKTRHAQFPSDEEKTEVYNANVLATYCFFNSQSLLVRKRRHNPFPHNKEKTQQLKQNETTLQYFTKRN